MREMALLHRWVSIVLLSLVASLSLGASSAAAQRRGPRRGGASAERTIERRGGSVVFDQLPDGAEVSIDEQVVGVGPMGPVDVAAGQHTVRVRLEGYSEYTDVIEVGAGQEVRIPVDLFALAHVLVVATTPEGARLFVDERYRGDTPLDVDLADGEHQLRLSLHGYEDALRTIQAVSGERSRWDLELVAIPEQGPPQWYEDPIVWIVTGVSVVAVVALAIVIAVVAQPSANALDEFCAGDRCIRFDPPLM